MNSKKRRAIFRKVKNMPCYLCGAIPEKEELTVDHVPPQGLSPHSPDTTFLLLPAHQLCNHKYADQEQKFIAYLAMACGYKGNASADAAWAAAERGFKRNEIGRAGTPSKDLRRLVENCIPVDVHTRGGIYLGSSSIYWPAEDVDMKLIVGKIARGLYYHHTKIVVPETWKINIELGQAPEYILQAPIHNSLGDFFAYKGGYDESGSLWYMSIYRQAYALVRIDDPEQSIQLPESQPYAMRHISDMGM